MNRRVRAWATLAVYRATSVEGVRAKAAAMQLTSICENTVDAAAIGDSLARDLLGLTTIDFVPDPKLPGCTIDFDHLLAEQGPREEWAARLYCLRSGRVVSGAA
jgi:hypothetical protein